MRLALALLVALSACESLQSPDARARLAIERLSEQGATVPVPGDGAVEIPPGRLRAMGVSMVRMRDGRIDAVGRLSIEGRLDGMPISYMGDERFTVVCGRSCAVEGALAPRLGEVLATLLERRRAIEAGDAQALRALSAEPRQELADERIAEAAARKPAGWFIRVDRETAIVGEAVPGGGQKRLLLRRGGEGWRVAGGIL